MVDAMYLQMSMERCVLLVGKMEKMVWSQMQMVWLTYLAKL